MLKFEGYYIEEPVKIFDGRAINNKVNYSFGFFQFFKNNLVLYRSLNYSSFEELKSMQLEDLITRSFIKLKWSDKNSNVVISSDNPYGNDYSINIESENKLYNELTGKYLWFVSKDLIDFSKKSAFDQIFSFVKWESIETKYV